MSIEVVYLDDDTIHLIHERVPEFPMEVWKRGTPTWFWNFVGRGVRGSDTNMFVAIEKAMTDLTKQVEGERE